jgi:hypothetical protein
MSCVGVTAETVFPFDKIHKSGSNSTDLRKTILLNIMVKLCVLLLPLKVLLSTTVVSVPSVKLILIGKGISKKETEE